MLMLLARDHSLRTTELTKVRRGSRAEISKQQGPRGDGLRWTFAQHVGEIGRRSVWPDFVSERERSGPGTW